MYVPVHVVCPGMLSEWPNTEWLVVTLITNVLDHFKPAQLQAKKLSSFNYFLLKIQGLVSWTSIGTGDCRSRHPSLQVDLTCWQNGRLTTQFRLAIHNETLRQKTDDMLITPDIWSAVCPKIITLFKFLMWKRAVIGRWQSLFYVLRVEAFSRAMCPPFVAVVVVRALWSGLLL